YCDTNYFNDFDIISSKFNLSEYKLNFYKISNLNNYSLIDFDLNNIYITNIKYKIREIDCILNNNNSLKFLNEQLLDRFIDIKMRPSRINLATFRFWLYNNFKLDELDSLL